MRALAETALFVALAALAAPAGAAACGDADGSGTVSVIDAAHVLRAASGLPSACSVSACDLDGDGVITRTDAELALRRAVGLPIPGPCGTGSVAGTLSVPAPAGGTTAEREPNDSTATAQPIGRLTGGDTYVIAGAIDDGDDAFDGYRFVATEDVSLDLSLRFTGGATADLDLLIDDHGGTSLTCESSAADLERCAVMIGTGDDARAIDLAVVSAAGSAPARYTLVVAAHAASVREAGLVAGTGAGAPIDVAAGAYRGTEADFVPGEIVAAFRRDRDDARVGPGVSPAEAAAAIDRSGMAPDLEVAALDPAGPALLRLAGTELGGADARTPDERAARKLARARTRARTRAAAERLRESGAVAYAHPNYLAHAARVPSDPLFAEQWHYTLVGLPRAWDVSIGRDEIVVAVIDSGVRPEHPDLARRLVPGFDFISSRALAGDGDGIDPDPTDPGDLPGSPLGGSFHGTHVAGTIAAATDNGLGVAGVTWRTRIMALRVLGLGGGTVFDIAEAIRYAAGLPNVAEAVPPVPARVINLSLAVTGDVGVLRHAVDEAGAAGALVVAAAGNTASDTFVSPADFEHSVSVGAVDLLGELARYSSFGPRLDLAAPGGDTHVDLNGDGFPDGVLSTLLPGAREYARYQGTSMACAHVSGVAALLLGVDLTLSAAQLRAILEATAQDRGAPGRDDRYGFGLVDAGAAARAAAGLPRPSRPSLALDTLALDFAAERTTLAVRAANAGGDTLTISAVTAGTDDGAPWLTAHLEPPTSVRVTVGRAGLAAGTYRGRVRVDSNGGSQEIRVLMEVTPPRPNDVGPVVVRVLDAATGMRRAETTTAFAAGYRYRVDGLLPGPYQIVAGTDRDGDGTLCELGDLCGAFPSLERPEAVTLLGGEALEGRDFALVLVSGATGPAPFR